MSIAKMKQDLAIIQKLSDLPNSTDGLTAEQLKAKFDESGLEIQKWINEVLLPGLQAENLGFAGNSELDAADVQAAIELVHSQIRDVSAGSIANGTVSKEKLAAALLERVFGGRVWVSLDCPTAEDTPEREFPVGQLWLRPSFTVENLAGESWKASGCTAVQSGHTLQITGNQTVASATAVQTLTGIGQAGDRVLVVLDVTEKDQEITDLTVCFHGEAAAELGSGGVFETELQAGGSLTVQIAVQWPATSLAVGTVRVENVTVVNPDAVLRELEGTKNLRDWKSWLRAEVPFAEAKSGRELYVQTMSGVWQRFDQEVFPINRGGTGLTEIGDGELLYGKDGGLAKLEKPSGDAILQCSGGVPGWAAMSALADHGYARITVGSYEGNAAARTVTLPVTPRLLVVHDGSKAAVLQQGTSQTQTLYGTVTGGLSSEAYTAGVKLDGNKLSTYKSGGENLIDPAPKAWNKNGVTHPWVAIY